MQNPNRENNRYSVYRVPEDKTKGLYCLVEALIEHKEQLPRTLCYCRSIDACGQLYRICVTECPEMESHLGMFHSETEYSQSEEKVVSSSSSSASLESDVEVGPETESD